MYFFKIKLLYYFPPPRHLFKLLCDNIQNIINQVIPQCHFPFTLSIFSSSTTSQYPRKKNKSLWCCWCNSFTFSSRFSQLNLENFYFIHVWYIWFLKSDNSGKYLGDVVGVNSWFRNNSILTNMQICLFFSYLLCSFTNQLMNL